MLALSLSFAVIQLGQASLQCSESKSSSGSGLLQLQSAFRHVKEVETSTSGNSECPCVGSASLTYSNTNSTTGGFLIHVLDMGTKCAAWDLRSDQCKNETEAPEWCYQRWCYVDPCKCNLPSPPQPSPYFRGALINGHQLYYSYETCGSPDLFTENLQSACTNHETESKCLSLGTDRCAWAGPETGCLGKELVTGCDVPERTWIEWSWWGFSGGSLPLRDIWSSGKTYVAILYAATLMMMICVWISIEKEMPGYKVA